MEERKLLIMFYKNKVMDFNDFKSSWLKKTICNAYFKPQEVNIHDNN